MSPLGPTPVIENVEPKFRKGSEAEIQTWGNRWERCLLGLIRIGEAGAAAPQRCHGHQQWLDQKSSARANGIQGEQP
jgi:hypothetical protein